MSNKFSHTNQTQKPPAICIKPPPGPEYKSPPLTGQQIQGYVEYFDPATPSEGGMISSINLYPTGPANTWFGSAVAGIYKINLLMTADAQHTFLSYRLDWFVSNYLYDTILILGHPARSWAPFDSDQLTPMPQPWHGKIGWHLYS